MTPKEFIEKAIGGGWMAKEREATKAKYPTFKVGVVDFEETAEGWVNINFLGDIAKAEIFLDPNAWHAVGKSEGWVQKWSMEIWSQDIPAWNKTQHDIDEWKYHWYQMIDALDEGKTIEEYLATL